MSTDTATVSKVSKLTVKPQIAWNPPVDIIKSWVLKAGNKIGSVWFIKKSTGELRRMTYRLHTKNPSAAKQPNSLPTTQDVVTTSTKEICQVCKKEKGIGCTTGPFKTETTQVIVKVPVVKVDKKIIDDANDNITVLDCNAIARDKDGNKTGRGQWKSIPLANITRIKVNGEEIIINKY